MIFVVRAKAGTKGHGSAPMRLHPREPVQRAFYIGVTSDLALRIWWRPVERGGRFCSEQWRQSACLCRIHHTMQAVIQ
jgi:hypothetical protein